MFTEKNLSELIINVLDSEEDYDKMLSDGAVNDDELYLVKDTKMSITMKKWTAADFKEV